MSKDRRLTAFDYLQRVREYYKSNYNPCYEGREVTGKELKEALEDARNSKWKKLSKINPLDYLYDVDGNKWVIIGKNYITYNEVSVDFKQEEKYE